MITYNHEKYISEAIEGVLMQETDFPIELVIGEDFSTDKTREICQQYQKKYPQKIRLLERETNLGMMPNFVDTLQNCQGKYIAVCEGDDYWTDSHKLQKQLNFLELNSDYTICWTKYKIFEKNGLSLPDWLSLVENKLFYEVNLDNIFHSYSTYTLTVMFRRDCLQTEILARMNHAKDNSLYCLCLTRGKGAILNFFSAVYRIHPGGVFSSADVFTQRFLSYLNLKEILDFIPKCRNSHLSKAKNNLLSESFHISYEQPNEVSFKSFLKVYQHFLMFMPIKAKLYGTKLLIKRFLRITQ